MRLCLVNINDALWCPELSISHIIHVPRKFGLLPMCSVIFSMTTYLETKSFAAIALGKLNHDQKFHRPLVPHLGGTDRTGYVKVNPTPS